uniref:G_PROTEIN_RECEP_F1_2 domain-containing protein n=1 Tax=Meloidogyne hapla TaxID=6305 RepID=A0A1I8BVG2_MELHA
MDNNTNNNNINNPQLSSKIIPASICLFLFAIFLLPLVLFLIIILYNTKRLLHLNTRILLAVVPLSVILSLISRIFLLLLVIIGENNISFMKFVIYYPAFLANFFLNSLPITIGLEKFISTIFYNYYEKNKRLRFVGISILAIQLLLALVFSIIRSNITFEENNSQNISSLQHTIFNNLQIILPQVSITIPVFFLLFWNAKLSVTSNQSSSQNNISCRYQIRENCRTLRFCLFFVFLLGASTFVQILLHTFNDDESKALFLDVIYSVKHFGPFEEFLALFPSTLALLGTIFGHKSIRLSLLSRFGFDISVMEKSNTKQNKHLHINTVDGSLSSFSSNRTARVSDAKSVNELIRDAHFDILQNCWDKKT